MGEFWKNLYTYEHIRSYKQTNNFTLTWQLSISLTHKHVVPSVLGFGLSEHWSFVITDMISLCTDISSGSSDGSGIEEGWRMKGGSVQLQLADEKQIKRQEAQIKLRRVSENRSGGLLECVLNTAAPWGIRRPSSRSDLVQREQLTDFLLSR